jgi:hypothetical protein
VNIDAALLRAVSPKTGAQFSVRFHLWLGRMRHRHSGAMDIRAWRVPGYRISPYGLLLGYESDGDIIGSSLASILRGKATIGCYSGGASHREFKAFWPRYVKHGLCAFDVSHGWDTKKNFRVCRWCGVEQRLRSRIERRVVQHWEAA